MKSRILIASLVLVILLGLNSCVTLQPFYYGTYDISMSEVERPAKAKERY